MKILVTGTAGFVGFHVANTLVSQGHEVVGLDNINDYYTKSLKYARLEEAGIRQSEVSYGKPVKSHKSEGYSFVKLDLSDDEGIEKLFREEKFDVVCHLAAQAGVRYSIQNPKIYVESNVVGFLHILEACRNHHIKHLVFASSSSVYGMNKDQPFKTTHRTDSPVSLYAATKKSNELMAYTYSHLFNLPTTGLRFFTVYGPWGRPDMAPYLFVDAITKGLPIKVFNEGNMERDFTYVGDIANGVSKVIHKETDPENLYRLYNIGNNKPVKLMDFIAAIENALGKEAEKIFMPMQMGDVVSTYADVESLMKDFNYRPDTNLSEGVAAFVKWFQAYHFARQPL